MIKITSSEFTILSKYIHEISGISLEKGKEYLIETRLNPLLDDLECSSYTELHKKSTNNQGNKEIEKQIIDAISTNETYFFRDNAPFELLQHKIVPDLIDSRSKKTPPGQRIKIRIWCAANSTGQEIYSIAMTLKELYLDEKKYDIKLLGTDISNAAIAQASYGKYNKFEIARGLPQAKLHKYFTQDGDHWRIKDEIRSMVMFKKMNLMEPIVGLGKFDIVFCRNVAIYFTGDDRKTLYEKIASTMESDGYLIIGSTESLANDSTRFEPQRYLRAIFYQFKQ